MHTAMHMVSWLRYWSHVLLYTCVAFTMATEFVFVSEVSEEYLLIVTDEHRIQ